jgi:hypothetical protein
MTGMVQGRTPAEIEAQGIFTTCAITYKINETGDYVY